MDTLFDLFNLPASMNSWFVLMLTLFVKGTLILTATGLIVYVLRRSSAAVRHLAWCAGLLSLLVLPVLSALLPQYQTGFLPQTAELLQPGSRDAPQMASAPSTLLDIPTQTSTTAPLTTQITDEVPPTALATPQTARAETPEVGLTSPRMIADLGFHWSTWLFLIWSIGLLFLLIRMAIAHGGVHLLVRRGTSVHDDEWQQLAREMANRLGIRRSVRLRWSAWTKVPLSVGVWRPTIILPANARAWGQRQRQTVLLHELAHVRRRDCLMQLLAQFTCAVHWFNPLAWVAARQVRIERERATDDMVLLAGVQASTYAEVLLEIANSLRSAKKPVAAALAMARHHRLESRLMAILDSSLCHSSLNRSGATIVVLIVACIVLPLAVLHPAQAHTARNAVADDVGSDTTLTPVDAHLTGTEEIIGDAGFDIAIEPSTTLNPGAAIDADIDTNYENTESVDSNWEAAVSDTLTTEQLNMLRRRYGIDSTYIHEIEALGFKDLGLDDYIALGENDIDPDFIRGMQAVGYEDLAISDLVALATHDIDPNFVRGMQAAGLVRGMQEMGYADLTMSDFISLAINDIDPNYVRGMQAAGLTDLTKSELISMAINEIDPNYVRGMQEMGYADLTMSDFISLAINDIDPNYVRGMQAAGLTDLTRSELISMAINEIDPNYVRGMQEMGYADLTMSDFISLAINDIDPNYVRGMQAAGLTDLTRSELISMAINEIDPNYVRGMQEMGYADLTMSDFISLAINDIDPNYVRGMQAAGLTDLTRSELISMAINEIDPNYVRGMQEVGYADLTMSDFISLAINDIDPNYVRGMQAAGLTDLTRSELISMAINEIDPNYVRGMQEMGYADLTMSDFISLAINDIDPNYVRGMQAAGLTDLTRSELISMAINEIDPNYVRGMQEMGYADLTIKDFISLAINDIDPNYVRGMQAAGLTDLTRSELIALAMHRIDPNYVRGMQAAGYVDLTVAELVALAKKSMGQE